LPRRPPWPSCSCAPWCALCRRVKSSRRCARHTSAGSSPSRSPTPAPPRRGSSAPWPAPGWTSTWCTAGWTTSVAGCTGCSPSRYAARTRPSRPHSRRWVRVCRSWRPPDEPAAGDRPGAGHPDRDHAADRRAGHADRGGGWPGGRHRPVRDPRRWHPRPAARVLDAESRGEHLPPDPVHHLHGRDPAGGPARGRYRDRQPGSDLRDLVGGHIRDRPDRGAESGLRGPGGDRGGPGDGGRAVAKHPHRGAGGVARATGAGLHVRRDRRGGHVGSRRAARPPRAGELSEHVPLPAGRRRDPLVGAGGERGDGAAGSAVRDRARPSSAAPVSGYRRGVSALTYSRLTGRVIVANLVVQILIIATGGAVRLTGSGLGCSSWPNCAPGQFTPTLHGQTSFHPYVAWGNRMMGAVVVVVALAMALLVFFAERRGVRPVPSTRLLWLATTPLLLSLVQAVLGGLTVVLDLHPALVGSHFLFSAALVWLSTWLVITWFAPGQPRPAVPARLRTVGWLLAAVAGVVVVLGM